ncbi:MAG: hypothetical protein COA80_17505 [Leeuwenhoekiella sp.]|nr:MAG: hypothetical protein COA80_17505 [Leeuwenhoekiella sp.]
MRFFFGASFSLLLTIACSEKIEDFKKESYLFEKLDPKYSSVDFVNQIREDQEHSILSYIYYYNGGGVATGDVNNDGLPDLYFVSNQNPNQLYLNKGSLSFENVSDRTGISGSGSWSSGATMVDINADGWLDIYVCNVSGLLDFQGHNELFINNGDGTFTERSKEYGLDFQGYATQSYFFDYDKDGDLDMYLVNHAIHTTLSHGPAALRETRAPLVGDILFRNDGGLFTDVSEVANIYGGVNSYGLSASIADFNNDGWEDIYVCNDFHEDDYLYINNQDGTFTEELNNYFSAISRFSMGSDTADLNKDGFVDLITLDMLPGDEKIIKETEGDDVMFNMREKLRGLGYKDQYSRNMLQINHSGNFFVETAILNNLSSTDWSWAALFGDFNNDRSHDLLITNGILRRPNALDFKNYVANSFKGRDSNQGLRWLYNSINEMPSGKVANQIFKGSPDGFENTTGSWIADKPSLSQGAAYVDLDVDGDLDLVINNLNAPADIYLNNSKQNNFIQIALKYKDANLESIGAKVVVYDTLGAQTKWLQKSRGFLSSVEGVLHFGLGDANSIDSIKVVWPDLSEQGFYDLKANQKVSLAYNPAKIIQPKFRPKSQNNLFKEIESISFSHEENSTYDFLDERLIPYRLSMKDPAYAKGDVDGDGREDLFIGNSENRSATIFFNKGTYFQKSTPKAFEKDAAFEDSAACFFDADQDGDLDLYVGSGIGKEGGPNQDRLYINIDGTLEKSQNRIPQNILNTSVVIAEDFDLDGDTDLFVGNRSTPQNFGRPTASTLLVNDGTGYFKELTEFEVESFVTDACWVDLNKDSWVDLVISAEWDAPYVFYNRQGTFKQETLPKPLEGLWQSVEAFDIDQDGDLDIILGNYGLNTKYSIQDLPVNMYFSDFDKNGESEVVTSYTVNDNQYPINSRQELISQMNFLARRFNSNVVFSGKTLQQIFGQDAISEALKYEVNVLDSGYLENQNGKFTVFKAFDAELQVAPMRVLNVAEIGEEKILLVFGNALDVNTYHGGYTSLKGFAVKTLREYFYLSDFGVDPVSEQLVGATSLSFDNGKLLVLIKNDAKLITYKYDSTEGSFDTN